MIVYERGTDAYEHALSQLARRGEEDLERVEPLVRDIVAQVRSRGDEAVSDLTEHFEERRPERIRLDEASWRASAQDVPADVREALQEAATRIRRYHEHQRETGFHYEENDVQLGQRVRPVRAAGVYAPGGKARYPSTVLMTAVPAAVAGVPRIVLATPRPSPELVAAAELAGVTEIIDIGGAQAIAALAYGTESVERVDKIVGPGNLYVACAKRQVFGTVDIDSIAGPSEALILADESASPRLVAADLLTQAEHDEDAYPMLVTPSREHAHAVEQELTRQLETLPRRSVAEAAVQRHGHCFVVGDLEEAVRVADHLAPEHLSLLVEEPDGLLDRIGAAGAIFVGANTPETAGDYAAGPSHVLPTGGAARYGSPLGVYDFVARSSVIRYGRAALDRQANTLQTLARLEGLEAHARAVDVRREP